MGVIYAKLLLELFMSISVCPLRRPGAGQETASALMEKAGMGWGGETVVPGVGWGGEAVVPGGEGGLRVGYSEQLVSLAQVWSSTGRKSMGFILCVCF